MDQGRVHPMDHSNALNSTRCLEHPGDQGDPVVPVFPADRQVPLNHWDQENPFHQVDQPRLFYQVNHQAIQANLQSPFHQAQEDQVNHLYLAYPFPQGYLQDLFRLFAQVGQGNQEHLYRLLVHVEGMHST
ncbi:hypothetical protein O3P69_020736 [Scylla paramamosain]|uniref:Uncharacterized protein n=1 Tax=Scylla paramamosain TaxID=85552 RepID=A0AAW0TQT5_SCYPA